MLELGIVSAIIGVASAILAPNMLKAMRTYRLNAAAQQVADAFQSAKFTAVRANTDIEAQIIQLVNGYRVANGLAPLAVNGELNVAADLHSRDMAAIGGMYGPTVGMQHTLYGTTRPEVTEGKKSSRSIVNRTALPTCGSALLRTERP